MKPVVRASAKPMKPRLPKGPRNLKAGGFKTGLWRLDERSKFAKANEKRRLKPVVKA